MCVLECQDTSDCWFQDPVRGDHTQQQLIIFAASRELEFTHNSQEALYGPGGDLATEK